MSEQITISNSEIAVTLSSIGAQIISVKKNGEEKIWIGDPAVWPSHAPILFPICGGLKDDKYTYEGKEYSLQKHGYVRFMDFELESHSAERAVFLHRYNEDTLKQFPFEYEFRAIYTLKGDSLKVDYCVKNLSDKEMYFSVGGHEGYYCPEGIEESSVIFEEPEMLNSSVLDGNLLLHETVNVGKNTRELPLKYEYFAVDALVFLNLKSRKVTLKNNRTGATVGLEFEGQDFFLLWTKPGAKYICLEPWCSHQDFVDSDYDLKSKRGMIRLSGKEEITKTHTILF